jgi:peptidoglycan hydrolase-like protein with peptidoglycan-binding domain
MRIIRSFIAPAAALAVASGIAVLPALASAPPASAAASCTGTSLLTGALGNAIRLPTVGNGTGNDNCQLGVGNNSVAVARLQIALDQCDLNPAGYHQIATDGSYGPDTAGAVTATQRFFGITQDGIYGPQTRNAMFWPVAGSGGGACEKL